MTGYPPEPWDLRGQLHLTVWRVGLAALPALPDGLRPVRLGRTALVGTAWVIYEPGGVLSYRELLVAVLVRHRGRPMVSITDIWVDSEASLRGGRELWGIPKELASFAVDRGTCTARDERGAPVARGSVRPAGAVPGRWPIGYMVAQQLAGQLALTPVRSVAGLRLVRTTWSFAPDGPLAWLRGARPLLSVSLRDFVLRFGPRRSQ
ncbi:MAG: acetoacetate decarboxylase family protein [Pseudonocardiaceae bacterium]